MNISWNLDRLHIWNGVGVKNAATLHAHKHKYTLTHNSIHRQFWLINHCKNNMFHLVPVMFMFALDFFSTVFLFFFHYSHAKGFFFACFQMYICTNIMFVGGWYILFLYKDKLFTLLIDQETIGFVDFICAWKVSETSWYPLSRTTFIYSIRFQYLMSICRQKTW